MALPKAVQQQEEEAERMLAELNDANTSPDSSGKPGPASPAPEPTPTEGDNTLTELEKTVHRLEQSYAVLKGKYDAEVPRLSEALRSATEENRTLQEELEAVKQATAEMVFEEDPDAAKRYLSDQELEEVDESAIEFQARLGRGVAEDVTQAHVGPMQAQIAELEKHISRLEKVQHSAKKSQFWEKVDALAPGAMEANSVEDPEWVAFLETTDDGTGLKYRDIGLAAIKRGDAQVVARLFKKCKGDVDPGGPTKEELISQQASPRTSRSGATATATASMPQPVKESEIRETYRLAALGKISQEDLAVREAEFDRAASEGLVIFRQ